MTSNLTRQPSNVAGMRSRWQGWLTRFKVALVVRGWETPGMAAEIRGVRSAYDDAYLARVYATMDANTAASAWRDGHGSEDAAEVAAARRSEAVALEVACARRYQDLTGEDMLDGRLPTEEELRMMLTPAWNPTRDFRGRPVPSGDAWITVRSPRAGPKP